jgi:hypothetical protein
MGLTVNDICKSCNEGWLEELENRVRPFACDMIGGRSMALSVEQVSLLAAWAYKTILIFDLRNPKDDRAYLSIERQRFYESPTAH